MTAIGGVAARRELREQKRQYERLAERISTAYYAVDEEWTITYWNDRMAERTGRSAESVVGCLLWTEFPELLGTRNETEYRAAMTNGEPRSFETYLDHPYDYWVEIDVFPDEAGLSIFSREITERKEREAELARAKRRMDAIVDHTSEAIYIKNREGEYVFINEVGAQVFDARPQTVVGRTDEELFDADSAAEICADDEQVMNEETSHTWERTRYVDGEEKIFIDNKFPYRTNSGEVVGIMGVSRDITDRKRRERRITEQRDTLDLLNEVVRHDIRNDLQLIGGYGEMLTDLVAPDGQQYLEIVRNSAESATQLTFSAADLADAIRRTDSDLSGVALRPVLLEELAELRETAEDASVEVDGSVPAVEVRADELLSSLFRNLLRNAVVHNDKPRPEVTVSATETTDAVRVEVRDNGPGVPDRDRTRLFGKGEKRLESDGTGIGLYLVRTLVDQYGGDIRVEDNTPEGAVFVVELPTAA